jgi:hypothetical protein
MKAEVEKGGWEEWLGRDGNKAIWEEYMRGFEGEMEDSIKLSAESAAEEP